MSKEICEHYWAPIPASNYVTCFKCGEMRSSKEVLDELQVQLESVQRTIRRLEYETARAPY